MNVRKTKIIVYLVLAIAIIAVGVVMIINPIVTPSLPSFSSNVYPEANMYTQASSGSVSNITNLYISWVSGLVEIVPYEGKTVAFEEKADTNIPEDEQLCFWKDGNTLRIHYITSGLKKVKTLQKRLYVYIPEKTMLNKLEVEVVSADMKVSNLNVVEADLSSVSGDVILDSVVADNFEYESVSGDLITKSIGFIAFDGESVSGSMAIDISEAHKTEKIELEAVSGDVDLHMPESFGFELKLETVSGDIKSSVESTMLGKNRIKHGNGFVKIDVETVSGNVSIK